MKPDNQAQSGKLKRLFAWFLRTVVSGLAFVSFVPLPRSAHAVQAPKPTPSLGQRVANVRQTLEKIAPPVNPSNPSPHLMQWYNWNNWGNWPNWGNWNNWNNWGNWINW